jgi:putative ABC transport system permease protein
MSMNFLKDVAFAIRGLRKDLSFALVAVFTLALAIGANSAIFSVINAVLIRPLPYKNPDRIVRLWEARDAFTGSVSWPNLQDWRQQNTSFEALAAIRSKDLTLRAEANPQHLSAAEVSSDFFRVLGVQPLLGRTFLPGEDQAGSAKLVVLSEGLWRGQFGSDPGVIGQSVTLSGEPHTVIAVVPAYLNFPAVGVQAWVPLVPSPSEASSRGEHMFEVIGRLKPDVPLDQAQKEMVLIARRIAQQFPDIQVGRSIQIVNLQEQLVRNTRPTLIALFGAVGFVLLIACANVANLLLARATARRREIAIRTALGASRGQLLFQFLTESVLISLLGGVVGIVLAKIGMASLIAWAGPYLPRAQEVTLDLRVLMFSIAISILTGVICGIIPGLQSSKEDIQLALKQGGTSAGSPQSNWATGLLAIGETAAAVVLLIGAGLLMKSVLRLEHVDPGFQIQNVITVKMALPPDTYKPDAAARFYTDLRHRVAQLPGVQAVGVINILPVESYGYNGSIDVEGLPHFVNDPVWAIEYRFVSPGYFQALNIPLVRGRDLAEGDFGHGSQYAMVNQTFARMISQYGDPLGRHILNVLDDPKATITIVGIAADIHQAGLDLPVRPEVYFLNDMPIPSVGSMNLVVRTVGDPGSLVGAIRKQVAEIDPNQTAYEVKTMQTVVDNSISGRRFTRTLILGFAVLGTLLAVIGVYSVLSYLVTQHTREIGIRLALGAQSSHVVNMVLKQGAVVGLMGMGIGAIGAFALTRWLSSMLFQVKSYDLPTFFGASALLFIVVLVASYIPARRTTQVDPMVALRQD